MLLAIDQAVGSVHSKELAAVVLLEMGLGCAAL